MNKKLRSEYFRSSRMVHDSKKPQDLGFMVQDEFSRPRFCVASAFWVYRGSVSVEQTQCLCGPDTVSGWDTHSVSVWDTHSPGWRAGGGSRATPTPHWGFPVPPTHIQDCYPAAAGGLGLTLCQAEIQPLYRIPTTIQKSTHYTEIQ